MPLEFALRPRIRLREDPPPRAQSRGARWRVPRFALPAALYWAAMAGICYGIIRVHDAPAPEPIAEARELAPEPEFSGDPAPGIDSPAAQAAPALELAPAVEHAQEPPSPEPNPVPDAVEEQPTPRVRTGALGEEMSRALLSKGAPRAEAQPQPRAPALAQELLAADSRFDLPPDSQLDLAPEAAPAARLAQPSPRSTGGALPSCEAAAAAAVQDLDFASSDRTADLPSEAISGVLENGAWLGGCALPSSTHLDVCVAIKGGRVTAVTVTSRPTDPALNACVKQRAAALQFPYSTRVDVARTRF
jgi:hypothetical protein